MIVQECEYSREYKQWITCPVCGFEYTHIGSVELINHEASGFDEYGTRGNQVRINMNCENEHYFTLIIAHHKGNTYVGAKPRTY
jgi:C4-type Zn-finger protein